MPIASLSTHASHVNLHFWVMQDWLLPHQHTHKRHACCHYLSLIHSQQLPCPSTLYLSVTPVHAHFTYQSHLSMHTLPISLTCPCTIYLSASPVQAHFTCQSHLSMHTLHISHTCKCTLHTSHTCQSVHINQYF